MSDFGCKERKGLKPSGIAWLGDVPEGWEMKYGKCVFFENTIKNRANDNETILSLSYGKIIVKKSPNDGLVPAEYSSYQVLSPGDIVVRCTDLQNDRTSLRVGFVENDGIITSAYLGLKVNKGYDPRFVFYFLHAWDVSKEIYRYGSGLRQSLSWDDFKYLPVVVPPLPEQKAIAAYLDEATGKIDKAIEAEERMVALLQERREIVINEAVGGGDIFTAEAQRSGVRRELPRGWEVKRLRHCFARTFSGLWGTDPSSGNSGIVCFRVADFDYARGGISEDKLTYRAYRNSEVASRLVEKGDLLLEKSGGGDNTPVGRVVIADKEFTATCSNFIQALRCKVGYSSKYIFYVFRSLYSKKVNGFYYNQTTGIQNLKVAEYLSLEVPIPPLPEQESIVKRLDEETGKIDRAIAVKRQQIELLRERRGIIVNEVVTGKAKVV